MSSASTDAPEIAIIGGGIGGLTAAAFLGQAGLRSTVYEQAGQIKEVGAGLVVAPNAARLLRRLGVMDRLAQRAVRLERGWEFRRWEDGTVLSVEDLDTACEELYGEHTYTAHRADLLDVVKSAVPEGTIRLGKRCTSVTLVDGKPEVTFEDAETLHPDIVIGADGIHSTVRPIVTEPSPAEFSGMCAYRALVPAERAPEFALLPAQTLWIGPGRHLVHYPVSAGRFVNIVAFGPAGVDTIESWTATVTVDELLHEFGTWDSRLVDLISASETPGRWALLDRRPLEHWSEGAITLLGDAAHPMFPFFAQGAAQSMEDAALLALCLAEGLDDVPQAFVRYERLRLPRTTRLQEISRSRAQINHLPDGEEQQARDQGFQDDDPLIANGWIYDYDPVRELAADAASRSVQGGHK